MAYVTPGYIGLHRTGELEKRAARARSILKSCTLCPRRCQVDRTAGEVGACGIGAEAVVSSQGPHFGEESFLVGRDGSGTIFFTGCSLACVFCQNYDVSQQRLGVPSTSDQLAQMMLDLQERGCHNINWVTPSHVVPQILDALCMAAARGLNLPIVYNCSGYEAVITLKLLNGVVDIYMPDIKYGANEPGERYSGVPDYWDRVRATVREMHRQVGNLVTCLIERDEVPIRVAARGLLVRHLVLPNDIARSTEVARFLARDISRDTFVNVMNQYRPQYRASDIPELNQLVNSNEFRAAMEAFKREGIHRFAR